MQDNLGNQRGSVLLYTLLVISAVLTTTLIVSNFVRNSIAETAVMNNVSGAHYAGESGVEKALYQIRKQDALPIAGSCGLRAMKCEWQVAEKDVLELKLDLAQDQSIQIDLAKPESNVGAGVESIGLRWENLATRLEVTSVELSTAGAVNALVAGETSVQKSLFSGGLASANGFASNKNYRVRVKALYGDAKNLSIKLFSMDNQLGAQRPFANFLKISGSGSYMEANQTVSVDMNRYAPTQGLFDYVLFSEEALVK